MTYKKHIALEENDVDQCFYWRRFTSEGYGISETNQLIKNLKIMDSETHRLTYKENAINVVVGEFIEVLRNNSSDPLNTYTFVPIPPSKIRTDSDYNNRVVKILKKVKEHYPSMDVRELVFQKENTQSDHQSNKRQTIEEILGNYCIEDSFVTPMPSKIVIFDDVITAGRHFKAMQKILSLCFPDVPLIGLFIARAMVNE